jgi:hypothetical protein
VLLFFPSFGASSPDQRISMEGAVPYKFITQADLQPRASDEMSDPMSSASQQSWTYLKAAGGAST